MTFKYLLDQISRYHKGRLGTFRQPPYIVYISACNPYPESDLAGMKDKYQKSRTFKITIMLSSSLINYV